MRLTRTLRSKLQIRQSMSKKSLHVNAGVCQHGRSLIPSLTFRCRRTGARCCAGRSPLGVKRENIEAFIWPSVIAAALWTGMPTIDIRQLIGAVVGLCIFVILVVINRKSKNPLQDLCAQIGLLFALAGFIWFFGAEDAGTKSLVYANLLRSC